MNQQPDACKAPLDHQGPDKQADVNSGNVETKGDAGGGSPAGVGAPLVTPLAPVRHVLPQIPTMSHSRLAVSKASRKETQTNTRAQQPLLNIVPQAELEKPIQPKPKTEPATESKEAVTESSNDVENKPIVDEENSSENNNATETDNTNEQKNVIAKNSAIKKESVGEKDNGSEENKTNEKENLSEKNSSTEKENVDEKDNVTKENNKSEKEKASEKENASEKKETTGKSETSEIPESATSDATHEEEENTVATEVSSQTTQDGSEQEEIYDPDKTENVANEDDKKTPAKTRDTGTDAANPPTSIPTPPSEDPSPKALAQQQSPTGTSPPTPIKLRIKRNTGSGLTSSVTIGEEGREGASIEVQGQQGKESSQGSTPTSAKRQTKAKAIKGKKVSRRLSARPEPEIVKEEIEEEMMETEVPPSQEPTEEALKAAVIDPNVEPEYNIGDMLWAKVGGHPFWACMVSRDPLENLFWKQREKKKAFGPPQIFFLYHVQFFGEEAERAWVSESAVLPYQGVNAFHEHSRQMTAKHKGNRVKFEIKSGRRRAWDIAVVSAEDAYSLNVEERCKLYTFNYQALWSKQKKNTDPPQDAAALPNGAIQRKRKHEQDKAEPSSDPRPARKRRRQASMLSDTEDARFSVFCQKRRKSVLDDNPDFNEEQVESELLKQWNKMPVDDQLKFIPMGSDVKHVAGMLKSRTTPEGKTRRSLKPTKKLLEADVDNDLFAAADDEADSEPEAGKRKRRSIRAAEAAAQAQEEAMDIDSIVDSVASGAGDLPEIDEPRKPQKVKRKKSLLAAVSNEDTASETASQSGDDFASRHKKYDFTGCDPMGDLPLDYQLEVLKLSGSGPRSKDGVCVTCEESGDLLTCEGACGGSYHRNCAGLSKKPSLPWTCKSCQAGRHECFVCRKIEGEVKQCKVAHCGKFYHVDCASSLPHARVENSNIYCPLHVCNTCVIDNPKNPKCSKGRFYRCVRCPTAYHVGELCIAAGSVVLEGTSIVCSKHFIPIKTNTHHSHINVSWCFMCSKGGTLLCCESCPAAYHVECLGLDVFPEGSFFCKDCKDGRRPQYGDIVWVKLGSYRWWPGEICHPTNVPLNIQDKNHHVGEFPVRFFGSHDYFWTHHARAFPFQEGDLSSKECNRGTSVMKQFAKGVREATAAFRMSQKVKEVKAEEAEKKNATKPRPFRHIKVNLPVGDVLVYKPDLSIMPRCDCKKGKDSDPEPCSEQANCMNRMLMYECHPQLCLAKEDCQNQRFQRRTYPKAESFRTQFGWGLKTMEDIKKGQFVNEYVGELIDDVECKRRLKQQQDDDIDDFYMLTLDKGRIIDAGPKGNLCRFMNHSCNPNCETTKWNVNGDVRVGLFATRDIVAGEELTFNYNLDCLGNDKKKCQCGAPNCSGYLGVPPKNSEGKDKDKKKSKKKKKKRRQKHEHEDECYRCGEGGELVMCDRSWCPKSYHLECLNLKKPPNGKWECPWHHCDVCGKGAIKLCSECPNSFCKIDIKGNIYDIGDAKLLCSDHDDLLSAIESAKIKTPEVGVNDARMTSSSSSASASSTPRQSQSEDDDSAAENLVIDETRGDPPPAATETSAPGAAGEDNEADKETKVTLTGVDENPPKSRSNRKSLNRKDSKEGGSLTKSARSRKGHVTKSRESSSAKESNNNITNSDLSPEAAATVSGDLSNREGQKEKSSGKRKKSTGGQKSRKSSEGSTKKKGRQSKGGSAENAQPPPPSTNEESKPSREESGDPPPPPAPAQDDSTDDELGHLVIDIPL